MAARRCGVRTEYASDPPSVGTPTSRAALGTCGRPRCIGWQRVVGLFERPARNELKTCEQQMQEENVLHATLDPLMLRKVETLERV